MLYKFAHSKPEQLSPVGFNLKNRHFLFVLSGLCDEDDGSKAPFKREERFPERGLMMIAVEMFKSKFSCLYVNVCLFFFVFFLLNLALFFKQNVLLGISVVYTALTNFPSGSKYQSKEDTKINIQNISCRS